MSEEMRKELFFDIDEDVAAAILGSKAGELYDRMERFMNEAGFHLVHGSKSIYRSASRVPEEEAEALFYLFFVQKDPFECIALELNSLRYRDLKPKARRELHQKMTENLGDACEKAPDALPYHWYERFPKDRPDFVIDSYLRSIGYSRDKIFDRIGNAIDHLLLPEERMSENVQDVRYAFIIKEIVLLYRKRWGGNDVESVLRFLEETARTTERDHIVVPRKKV